MPVRPMWKHPRHTAGFLHASRGNALTRRRSTARATEQTPTPLTSVLIANRGEIALRVGRTASESGIRTTTIYTEPDARAQHALSSPFAVNLGDPGAYLHADRIIEVAKREGCDSIHPGYGFLSENSAFARKCAEAGIVFIGPPWKAIEAMGSKSESKDIMTAAGVPCIPGYHGANQDADFLQAEAAKIGYPVLLKAVKGGGGRGMRIVRTPADFPDQLTSARSEAWNSFGDDRMLVEKYITTPRHIEVQVFADKHGNCVALGERDCSIQRRHQKILEESPAPFLAPAIRHDLWSKARAAALAVGYEGAGTVEFIFDNDTGEFFFMEMNTRLQVEHPVTEMVTGEDLVRWQFLVAEGRELPLSQAQIEARIAQRGWAIEARIYAENPDMNFMPDSGRLIHLKTPQTSATVRIDAGFVEGDEVSTHYDPMIAKLIVRAPNRHAALHKLETALEGYEIVGPKTNIEFLKRVCAHPDFIAGQVETGFIEKHRETLFARAEIEDEAFAQAALGILFREQSAVTRGGRRQQHGFGSGGGVTTTMPVGFAAVNAQQREISLTEPSSSPSQSSASASASAESWPVSVRVCQTGSHPDTFDIEVDRGGPAAAAAEEEEGGVRRYANVISDYDAPTQTLTTWYPHLRLATTLILQHPPSSSFIINKNQDNSSSIHLFHRGKHHILQLHRPNWLEKMSAAAAAALSEDAHAAAGDHGVMVPAPMGGKVVRVMAAAGTHVKRHDLLVVIESMKTQMEVRSPRDGVVARVACELGERCEVNDLLVEFE